MANTELVVRTATTDDVRAVCAFGEEHIPPHYTPLLGATAANGQVRTWWNPEHIGTAAADGLIVIAEADGEVVGVAQRGQYEGNHVIWKLYVHPAYRSQGLGVRLIDALVTAVPADVERVYLEHFQANTRAAAFYEREGFTVDRIEPSPSGDAALAVVWRVRSRPSAQDVQ